MGLVRTSATAGPLSNLVALIVSDLGEQDRGQGVGAPPSGLGVKGFAWRSLWLRVTGRGKWSGAF